MQVLLGIVLFVLALLTSPMGTVRLLFVLAKWPWHAFKVVAGFFFPSLFMKSVRDECIVITGGAQGIGKLMAEKFIELGAHKVVLIDLNADGLEATAKGLKAKAEPRQQVAAYTADLSTEDAASSVMSKIQAEVGVVTMLINNAGIVTGKKILDAPSRLMSLTMKVNVEAHFCNPINTTNARLDLT